MISQPKYLSDCCNGKISSGVCVECGCMCEAVDVTDYDRHTEEERLYELEFEGTGRD